MIMQENKNDIQQQQEEFKQSDNNIISKEEELPRSPTSEELEKIKERQNIIDRESKEYSNKSFNELFNLAKQSYQLNASTDNIASESISKAIITKIFR